MKGRKFLASLLVLFLLIGILPDASTTADSGLYALLQGRVIRSEPPRQHEATASKPDYPARSTTPMALTGNIAFETNRAGTFDIYAKDADGSNPAVPLVISTGNDFTPVWSPDGTQMVFASDRDGDFDIYLRTAGGVEYNLTQNTAEDGHPSWSPTGDRIIFTSNRGGYYFQIYTMRTDGADARQVGVVPDNNAMFPRYSPDGSRIAFMRASIMDPICEWNWDVWVMDADGENQRRVTTLSGADLYPTWTLDGKEIVYAGCRNFVDFDLYTVNPDTMVERQVNSWFLSNEWGVTYSPDAEHIAFNTDFDGNTEIYLGPAGGGTVSNFTQDNADDLSPSWGSQRAPACNVTKQPVLLVHGWGASDRLEDDTGGFEKLYTWMQADEYVEGCNCFYATGVKASNSRDQNADAIQSSLHRAYDTFSALNPAWRGHFDIIGHSYGGLNARFYLESPRYADDAYYGQYGIHVDNLFTLGSPHGGVAITELFPGAVGVGCKYLNSEKWRSAVGLTDIAMFAYNLTHKQPVGVHYQLVGGDFRLQPNVPLLVKLIYAPWALIPNDAAVSQRSSLGLGNSQYRSVSLHPNTDMHGYSDLFNLGSVRSYVNPDTTYREVIAPHLGALAYTSAAGEPAIVGTQADSDMPQPLLIASEIITGGQIISGNVLVDWSGQSVFYAKWLDGDLDLTLSDPTGYVITPSVAASDPNVDYDKGALGAVNLATYSMTNTVTGNWSYTVTAPSGPYPILFDLYIIPDSPLVLRTSIADWHPFGAPVVITATLTYSTTPLSDATVQARVTHPDESESTITLHDNGVAPDNTAGDGIYSGILADTALGGYYYVLTEADGVYDTQPYHRTVQEVFTVASQAAALTGAYSDRTEDTNGDGQYEYLVVDVGVNAAQSGNYLVSAVLESVDGQYIDLANASVTSSSGPLTFSLYFAGDAIRESGLDGPYVVTQVLLLDDESLIKLDEAYDAWMTAAYNHDHFGDLRQLYLPIVLKNH